jgi:hypothetical protein
MGDRNVPPPFGPVEIVRQLVFQITPDGVGEFKQIGREILIAKNFRFAENVVEKNA